MKNHAAHNIETYLLSGKRLFGPAKATFLARGEYNENYLIQTSRRKYVFRINHGSQLGLSNQIAYEFKVLEAVAPSNVTPKPFFFDPDPPGLPGGILLMEYLPGGPLDYRLDLDKAGEIFARIHALPPSNDLIVQADPVRDIARESLALINRYPDHPRDDVKADLLACHERILRLGESHGNFFRTDAPVMANTEVNSGNFCISDQGAFLVDWEKAVVTSRYQDLGHFVCPTTTLWKTDITLGPHEQRRFLTAYAERLKELGERPPSLDELGAGTALLSKAVVLRGLSWCYMAWFEYAASDRVLKNADAFAVINRYLDNRQCFLSATR